MPRNPKDLGSYKLSAGDGAMGHAKDICLDDDAWAIRCLVVDTSTLRMSHWELLAPPWTHGEHCSDRMVSVGLTRQSMQSAPAHEPAVEWRRDRALALYRHHGRTGDWARATALEPQT